MVVVLNFCIIYAFCFLNIYGTQSSGCSRILQVNKYIKLLALLLPCHYIFYQVYNILTLNVRGPS